MKELSQGQQVSFKDSRVRSGCTQSVKLMEIPAETCKHLSITTVNNYTISQPAEATLVRKTNRSIGLHL